MNHLSLLHQPLSLGSIQHICFLQKALLKGVLINLSGGGTRTTFIKAICQEETNVLSFYPSASDNSKKKKRICTITDWNVAHY